VRLRAVRARIAVLAVAVTAIGMSTLAACGATASDQISHPTGDRSSAAAARSGAPASTSRTPSSSDPGTPGARSPSPLHSLASPKIQVTGTPKKVKARGALLADAGTGQVLWERGADTERPMASITKVMTALLVLQTGHLNWQVKIPKAAQAYAWHYGGESAGLRPGDILTVQQLLEAMLLPSGADAAYTLARVFGPGMPAFISKMNATAAKLGMTRTHFTSPDGLPYPTETSTYSTPSDLVTLGLAAMKYPVFRSIVDRKFFQLKLGTGHHQHQYWWDNTDHLIGSYQGVLGIKDGYTDRAGHCLLFEATRNGRTLIGAVLGSPATGTAAGAQDAAKVLNWGFTLPAIG
jgi:serine-type D-Ala-D-Ala carboxypeptidase (penicillin-binding protein 5/6)